MISLQTGALGLGPIFGAFLYDRAGYSSLLLFGIGTYAAAMVLVYGARPPSLPRPRRNEEGAI